jgi:hypothetical protein
LSERATCEACGRLARVHLVDKLRLCIGCHAAAIALGYDDDQGTLVGAE